MRSIQHKTQAGFAVALICLLVMGVVSCSSTRLNESSVVATKQTYEVLTHLRHVLLAMLDVESASRGYAITGEDRYLAPYWSGTKEGLGFLHKTSDLIRENENQRQRLNHLHELVQEKLDFVADVVKLRQEGDASSALERIASGRGKEIMDAIRITVTEMETEEKQLLQRRTERATLYSKMTMGLVLTGSFLALGLVGTSGVMVGRDFKKRMAAEAERDRFFNLSLDLFSVASEDGYFKRVNPVFTEILGWSTKEIQERPFLDFIHPEDHAATNAVVEQQMASGKKIMCFECRFRHKDGSWRTIAWRSAPQPGGLMFGTGRDVTEEKIIEETLRQSEENLSVTLNSIGDAVLATDPQGRVTRMNPVAERLTGWKETEAKHKPIAEVLVVVHEQTRRPAVIPVEKVLATGRVQALDNDTLLIARDGSEHPIADSAAPILDKKGGVRGVVLVFRDVSEEKKAKEAVRASEQRLKELNATLEQLVKERSSDARKALAALEFSEDGIFMFSPQSLQLHYVNEGAVRVFGLPREELLQMYALKLRQDLNEAEFQKMLVDVSRSEKKSTRFTTTHRQQNGREVPMEVNLQWVEVPGEEPECLCIVQDITERLQQEKIALRSQRLESLGTLAGGLAHDLNNALAPIMMAESLLKEQYPEESGTLDIIGRGTTRAAEMVKQLLMFARGGSGDSKILQIMALIKEIESIVRGTFPKNIRLVLNIPENLPTGTEPDHIAQDEAPSTPSAFRGKGETILLVDDEESIRKIGSSVLKRLNFHPLTASDGEEALIQVLENRSKIRAVITNLHMPHMDGFALIRSLRRRFPDLSVLLMTGQLDEATRSELLSLGITTQLAKPFTEDMLAKALASALGNARSTLGRGNTSAD